MRDCRRVVRPNNTGPGAEIPKHRLTRIARIITGHIQHAQIRTRGLKMDATEYQSCTAFDLSSSAFLDALDNALCRLIDLYEILLVVRLNIMLFFICTYK